MTLFCRLSLNLITIDVIFNLGGCKFERVKVRLSSYLKVERDYG